MAKRILTVLPRIKMLPHRPAEGREVQEQVEQNVCVRVRVRVP